MTAEKKDGHTGAGTSNADYPRIVFPQRRLPDLHHSPDQLSELCRGQNPGEPLRAYSPERTSEFAIPPACCSSSPNREPASRNQAAPGVQAAAALPSRSDGYKAAGPAEIELDPLWPAEYCLT